MDMDQAIDVEVMAVLTQSHAYPLRRRMRLARRVVGA